MGVSCLLPWTGPLTRCSLEVPATMAQVQKAKGQGRLRAAVHRRVQSRGPGPTVPHQPHRATVQLQAECLHEDKTKSHLLYFNVPREYIFGRHSGGQILALFLRVITAYYKIL